MSENFSKHKRQRTPRGRPQRRAHSLGDAFEILGVGKTKGHELVAQEQIRVIWFGPRLPKITDHEIDRLLREGITAAGGRAPRPHEPPAKARGRHRRADSRQLAG